MDHSKASPDDLHDTISAPAAMPRLTFDAKEYMAHLDGLDLTDAQKHQMLEALWSIMVSFVDLGFGIHPVQQAMEPARESKALASDSDDVPGSEPVHQSSSDTSPAERQSGHARRKNES
jgi:hypothetical protein